MTTAQLENTWMLVWSQRQAKFHIETADEMLRKNLDTYHRRRNHDSDWIVVAFADSHEQAHVICEKLKSAFDAADSA